MGFLGFLSVATGGYSIIRSVWIHILVEGSTNMRVSTRGFAKRGFMTRSGRGRYARSLYGGGRVRLGPRAPFRYGQRFRGRRAGVGAPELKFFDLDIDDATIAVGGNIAQASCNLIVQGVDENERIGRKCLVKQINWRFHISLQAQTLKTLTSDIVRVILYLDKQANGATAAVTDIVESSDYQTFNNLANKSRFRTLMDRTYTIVSHAGAGDGTTNDFGEDVLTDTLFKKCNISLEFSAGTADILNVRSNNIGVLLLSQSGLAEFNSKMRLRFSDV